jgi:hypothetical protein
VALVAELPAEAALPGNVFVLTELPSAMAAVAIKRERNRARRNDIVNTATDLAGTGKGNPE